MTWVYHKLSSPAAEGREGDPPTRSALWIPFPSADAPAGNDIEASLATLGRAVAFPKPSRHLSRTGWLVQACHDKGLGKFSPSGRLVPGSQEGEGTHERE